MIIPTKDSSYHTHQKTVNSSLNKKISITKLKQQQHHQHQDPNQPASTTIPIIVVESKPFDMMKNETIGNVGWFC